MLVWHAAWRLTRRLSYSSSQDRARLAQRNAACSPVLSSSLLSACRLAGLFALLGACSDRGTMRGHRVWGLMLACPCLCLACLGIVWRVRRRSNNNQSLQPFERAPSVLKRAPSAIKGVLAACCWHAALACGRNEVVQRRALPP